MIEVTPEYLASQGFTATLPERFWAKVKKTETCWVWIACKNADGYGKMIRNQPKRSTVGAHVVSWLLHFGPVPEGKQVLHNCPGGDNRACVRSHHLWLGTQAENIQDMDSKGRRKNACLSGESQGMHKLLWSDITVIRLAFFSGVSQSDLARFFKVTPGNINSIVHHRTWKP